MKTTTPGFEFLRQQRTAKVAAAAGGKRGNHFARAVSARDVGTADWPSRPNRDVLSERIPLFFISRDDEGFWLARHADLPIGGIFLMQRSAVNFAKRRSGAVPCATMILSEPHKLDTKNSGNRFAARLRPVKRTLKRLVSKLDKAFAASIGKAGTLVARISRARLEDRMLRIAMEADLYCGQYKHTNKNDDDLPMVMRAEVPNPKSNANRGSVVTSIECAKDIAVAAAIGLVVVGIIALRVIPWLPASHR
jgi:hypothetical protein